MKSQQYAHSQKLVAVHSQLLFQCTGCHMRVLRKDLDLSKTVLSKERDPEMHMRFCRFQYCSLACRRENYACSGPEDME